MAHRASLSVMGGVSVSNRPIQRVRRPSRRGVAVASHELEDRERVAQADVRKLGGGGEDDREVAGFQRAAGVRIRGTLDRHERMFASHGVDLAHTSSLKAEVSKALFA